MMLSANMENRASQRDYIAVTCSALTKICQIHEANISMNQRRQSGLKSGGVVDLRFEIWRYGHGRQKFPMSSEKHFYF